MPILEAQERPSPEDLLQAASRLNRTELQVFLRSIKAIGSDSAGGLSRQEAELLLAIHRGLPDKVRRRYRRLSAKRQAGAISDLEYAELLDLVQIVEQAQAERLERLIALARLRGVSLDRLMDDLKLRPPSPHAE